MLRIAPLLILCLPLAASADSLPATVVARVGDTAPGLGGPTFSTFPASPRLGVNGHVAFQAFLAGAGSNDNSFWSGTPGNLQLVMRENNDVGGPIIFTGNMGVDQNGYVSMWSQHNVLSFEDQQMNAYLPNGNGGNTLIAREGTTVAPGFAGGIFSNIGSGQANNNAGVIAFIASVTGGDTTFQSDQGLFTGTPGNLTLIAREGSAAPGATGTSPVFSTTTNYPTLDRRINNSGQVTFGAQLSGDGVSALNDHAIYVWTPDGGNGTLALAAQTGSTAPGLGSPTIRYSVIDESPGFNDAGKVAFRGQVIGDPGDGVTLVNNFGIWKGTPGNLEVVVRSDDDSPIPGVKIRSQDPNPRINAAGQVTFFSVLAGTGVMNGVNDRALWVTTPSGEIQLLARRGEAAPGTGAGVNFSVLDGVPPAINALGQVAFTATLSGTGVSGANDRGLWAGTPGNVSLVAREGDVIDLDPGAGVLNRTIQSMSFANGYSRHPVNPSFESASAALNDAGQIAWQAIFTAASGGGSAIFLTSLPAPPGDDLDGDYNDDGLVDTADFVVWQKFNGTSTDLPNDPNPVPIDNDQYTTWQTHFGESNAGAGGADRSTTVPEPSHWWLLYVVTAFGGSGSNGRRKRQ
jgi:hypothetical protein